MSHGLFGRTGIVRLAVVGMWIAALSLPPPSRAAERAGPTVAPGSARSGSVAVTLTDTVQQVTKGYGPEIVLRGKLQGAPAGPLGVVVRGVPTPVSGARQHPRPRRRKPICGSAVARGARGERNARGPGLQRRAGHNVRSGPRCGGDSRPPVRRCALAHPAGLAPVTTGFTYSGVRRGVHVRLDADGDGTTDADETTLETFQFTYRQPGLYLPRLTVTDASGQVTTVVTVVHVADREAMDARILPVWRGVKDALPSGRRSRRLPLRAFGDARPV